MFVTFLVSNHLQYVLILVKLAKIPCFIYFSNRDFVTLTGFKILMHFGFAVNRKYIILDNHISYCLFIYC